MYNEDELEFLKGSEDWLSNVPKSEIFEIEKGDYEKLNWLFENKKISETIFLRAQQSLNIGHVRIVLGGWVSDCPSWDEVS